MKEIKKIILLNMLQVIMIVGSFLYLNHKIEKHSVHPIYGKYKVAELDTTHCEPWDSCN